MSGSTVILMGIKWGRLLRVKCCKTTAVVQALWEIVCGTIITGKLLSGFTETYWAACERPKIFLFLCVKQQPQLNKYRNNPTQIQTGYSNVKYPYNSRCYQPSEGNKTSRPRGPDIYPISIYPSPWNKCPCLLTVTAAHHADVIFLKTCINVHMQLWMNWWAACEILWFTYL